MTMRMRMKKRRRRMMKSNLELELFSRRYVLIFSLRIAFCFVAWQGMGKVGVSA
jgi:hypothetical protein